MGQGQPNKAQETALQPLNEKVDIWAADVLIIALVNRYFVFKDLFKKDTSKHILEVGAPVIERDVSEQL